MRFIAALGLYLLLLAQQNALAGGNDEKSINICISGFSVTGPNGPGQSTLEIKVNGSTVVDKVVPLSIFDVASRGKRIYFKPTTTNPKYLFQPSEGRYLKVGDKSADILVTGDGNSKLGFDSYSYVVTFCNSSELPP